MSKKLSDAELLSAMKDLVKEIKAEVSAIAKKEHEEAKRHEATVKDLRIRLGLIRKRCPHPTTTYHPDPSGNSDSYYECNLCGAEV